MSAPSFRSCPLRGAPSLLSARRVTPSSLPKPPRIGSGQSSGISLVGVGGTGANGNFESSPSGRPGGQGQLINTDTADYSRTWNVVGDWKSLPRVPPLYVLGPTRTTVRADSGSPAEVAGRIRDALRELSLDAIYDDRRAKAFVSSADGVEFFVRLFQDHSDPSARGVVVEVQRKRGCAYRFHRHARAALRAASGAPPRPAEEAARGRLGRPAALGRSSARPAALGARARDVPPPPASGGAGADAERYSLDRALETADDLLRKDRVDANELGMESLVLLSDEESSGLDRALYVSRVLLADDEDKFGELKQMFAKLVVGSEDEGEDADEQDDFERCHDEMMRRRALTALGNSLNVLARLDSDRLRAEVLRADSWIGENGPLLPALVDVLGNAEFRPHDACEAARCLGAILAAAPEVARRRAKELGAPEKLMAAQGVGECRHSMLARASGAALVQL